MLLLEQQKEEEESPMLEEADVDVSAFLGNPSQGKELQQSFNSVQMTQKHQEEKVPTDEERTALSDELPMPSDINNGEIENNNNKEELDSMTSAELRELLNIKSFCNGLTDVNAGVISKNYRISLFAFLMSACVITQAVITTVASTWVIVGVSAGISLLVCLTCFYVFPKVIAKAALFVFLQTLLYMQITSPLNNFYLADKKCLPDGPHFDYFFYNTTSSVIGNVAGMLGVYAFAHFFANRSYRLTFIVTTIAEIIGSIFDLIIVMRWNVKLHIPDHVMYIWGDAVVYQAAYMLAWMPMVVLLSRLCPRGSEAMVYALLASISNLGQTMAQEVGAALLATVWPVVAQGPHCNFDNLKYLIIVGHLCLPLLIIPCVFLLIPAARVCDALDNEGKVIPKEKEENAIFEQEKKKKREKEAEPTADV
ncbi:pteridine transporter [Angomonas deanei]|uniref:BT1 family, putative n=1 Tax=Angomonas deanei TaxID=59799 RepID=A0A7G2CVI4_9TRYP|nr:pteridine transporter [Angomonas deanei]CAD2222934.1 BT1 family, putative [Angomonas deanei]|eukprot:EPY42928.1 pteridine transporter [Angomonas deanei]